MSNLINEKLQLEIKELKKPLLQKLEFWKTASPILAILLTILFTFYTGIFDSRREYLAATKSKLGWEIVLFETKRDSLIAEIQYLRNTEDSLNKIIMNQDKSLIATKSMLKQQLFSNNNLVDKLKLTQKQKEVLEDETKRNMQGIADMQQIESSKEIQANLTIQDLTYKLAFKEELLSRSFSFIKYLTEKCNLSKTDSMQFDFLTHSNSIGKFSLGLQQAITKMQMEENLKNK